jgi:hypothetical protein
VLQNGGGNGIDSVSVTHGTNRSLGGSRSELAIAAQLLRCTPHAKCRRPGESSGYPMDAEIDRGALAPARAASPYAKSSRYGRYRLRSRSGATPPRRGKDVPLGRHQTGGLLT